MTGNKATGNPDIRYDDDQVAACDALHMWEPATGETPDGDTLAASDAGQQAAKAQLVIAERLADLSDFDRLWRQA